MWHWFHLEHNIHGRDVCCYTLDCRKLQYYQYHVSFGSLLEYLSNSDMWYTVSPPCLVDLLLSSSFQGRGPELNFFLFSFSLVKALSGWAIIKSSGVHTTEVSSLKKKTGIHKIGWSWCSFILECSLCKNEIHYLWIDCCDIHQALVLQSLTTLSDICWWLALALHLTWIFLSLMKGIRVLFVNKIWCGLSGALFKHHLGVDHVFRSQE